MALMEHVVADQAAMVSHTGGASYTKLLEIPAASLIAGRKYLVLFANSQAVGTANARPTLEVRHGATVFDGGSHATGIWTRWDQNFWWGIWTATSGEALSVWVKCSAGLTTAIQSDFGRLMAIDLSLLVEGTDYVYNEITGSEPFPSAGNPPAAGNSSVTITPTTPGEAWAVFTRSAMTAAELGSGSGNRWEFLTRLSKANFGDSVQEAGHGGFTRSGSVVLTLPAWATMVTTVKPAAATTYREYGYTPSGVSSSDPIRRTNSAILAIRLSAFRAAGSVDPSSPLIPGPGSTVYNSIVQGAVVLGAGAPLVGIGSSDFKQDNSVVTTASRVRTFAEGTENPSRQTASHRDLSNFTNAYHHVGSIAYLASAAAGSRTVGLYGNRGTDGNTQTLRNASVIAFTLDTATDPMPQTTVDAVISLPVVQTEVSATLLLVPTCTTAVSAALSPPEPLVAITPELLVRANGVQSPEGGWFHANTYASPYYYYGPRNADLAGQWPGRPTLFRIHKDTNVVETIYVRHPLDPSGTRGTMGGTNSIVDAGDYLYQVIAWMPNLVDKNVSLTNYYQGPQNGWTMGVDGYLLLKVRKSDFTFEIVRWYDASPGGADSANFPPPATGAGNIPAGLFPDADWQGTDGTSLYVSVVANGGKVLRIRLSDGVVTGTLSVPLSTTGRDSVHSGIVDTDGFMYLAATSQSTTYRTHKVDLSTFSIVASTVVGSTTQATDDMTHSAGWLFLGVEESSEAPDKKKGWGVYAIRKSDMTVKAVPKLGHKDTADRNSYASLLFGRYLIDLKTDGRLYLMDLDAYPPESWTGNESWAEMFQFVKLIATFVWPQGITGVTNELHVDEDGKLHSTIWSKDGTYQRFTIPGYTLTNAAWVTTPVSAVLISDAVKLTSTASAVLQLTVAKESVADASLKGVYSHTAAASAVVTAPGTGLTTAEVSAVLQLTATRETSASAAIVSPAASVGSTSTGASAVLTGPRVTTGVVYATPKNAAGLALAGRVVAFTSSNPAVATVDALGVEQTPGLYAANVAAVAPGVCTITATLDGIVSNVSTVTVEA